MGVNAPILYDGFGPSHTMPDDVFCQCGAKRNPKFELCLKCAKESAAREGRLCACGRFMKQGCDQCLDCAKKTAAEKGELCECGGFKSAKFDKCRKCSYPGGTK